MKRQILTVAVLLLSIILQAQPIDHKPAQYNLQATLWQQQSGEYKALCYQAFALARLRLDELLTTNKAGMPLAIITDVDETILDNSPSAAHDMINNHGFDVDTFHRWVEKSVAKALPGAVEFFSYAAQHGVQCFYITNRAGTEKEATKKNLLQQGFPHVNDEHVMTKNGTSDKEPRRQEVMKTYNVVLLLGDNLNDFDDFFYNKPTAERNTNADKRQSMFGSKYIVLPNAVYGDWESALWHGQKFPTPQEAEKIKDAIKWLSLTDY